MRKFNVIASATALTALLTLFALGSVLGGAQGTKLTGQKTADAVAARTERYQWELQKSVDPSYSPSPIPVGATGVVPFVVSVTRSGPVVSEEYGPVVGEVCLTNSGLNPTLDLRLRDRLEVLDQGNWVPIGDWSELPVLAEIPAGATQCYPYTLPIPGFSTEATYRNHAQATLSNYEGFEGTEYTVPIYQPVNVQTSTETIDESALLSDLLQCPTGFSCDPLGFSQPVDGNLTIPFSVTVRNEAAACGSHEARNTVTLVTNDTGTTLEAIALAQLLAQPCGCVGSIGYWKNNLDEVALVLPIYLGNPGGPKTLAVTDTTIADTALSFGYGGASNGIAKLYAQLLGAKISIAKGADSSTIASVLAASDAFLATHDYLDWSTLTSSEQAQVTLWAATLEQYNTGELGVPHC
jgi:hypothetical protein